MPKQVKPPIDMLEYEELKMRLLDDPEIREEYELLKPLSRISTFVKLLLLITVMATCGVLPYVMYSNMENICAGAMIQVLYGG